MDKLGSKERTAIDELRGRMKDELKADMYEDTSLFYRFLKARNFDVDEAEKMLQKHLIWKKLHQVDTILEDWKPREFFPKHVEPNFIGFDKDGYMVLYCPAGKIEMTDTLQCVKFNNYLKYWIWHIEKNVLYVKEQHKMTGPKFLQASYIIDLDMFTFRNATNKASGELMFNISSIYQNNYPECLKNMYIINAPVYFTFIYNIIKLALSKETVQKIHVFGHSGWKEELLGAIDANVLPAFLGGNRTDPDGDPTCRSFINQGGEIPSSYFLPHDERYFSDRTKVTKILVPKMDKVEISFDVEQIGSRIKWEFYTKSNIGFGLFFCQTPGQDLKEVIPIERYRTPDGTMSDFHKAKFVGKYIIIFDNTYSWVSSKEVEYCIEVNNPS